MRKATLALLFLIGCSGSTASTGASSGASGSGSASATSAGSGSSSTTSSTTTSSTTGASSTSSTSTSTTTTGSTGTTSTTTSSSTSTSGSSGTTGSCGTCPANYTCGSANGIPVCRAPSGVPRFSRVIVIPMENTSWSTLDGDSTSNTPYLHGLKNTAAYSTAYHGISHPSLPNYIAMISGSDQGIGCDCQPAPDDGSCDSFSCNLVNGSCNCGVSATSIVEQLADAGEDFRDYAESMTSPCEMSDSADGGYAVRHVPFLYFSSVAGNSSFCNDHVVQFSNLATDLATAPRDLLFVTPNLVDDMHDPSYPNNGPQNLHNGDTWLSTEVPSITQSPAYEGALLVIVWDEDDNSGGFSGTNDPIPMYILSPYAKTGYPSAVTADHYSLLATIEDGLGLPRTGGAVNATPLADFFPAQ